MSLVNSVREVPLESLGSILASDLDLPASYWEEKNKENLQVANFETSLKLAGEIFEEVMVFRRMVSSETICSKTFCHTCSSSHLKKVTKMVLERKPIVFILPAFPGKSPNLAKVLSPLPDLAEHLSLQFLEELCHKIKKIYSPGAQIILCSDGRVFSDVVGMEEAHVTAYKNELDDIIGELSLNNISTLTMEDLFDEKNIILARKRLIEGYCRPVELLREKVKRGGRGSEASLDKEAHRMYCGITRFLFEDSLYPAQTKSRTAIQKDCKIRAYEVIRRSNAWSELLGEHFPEAVRLSIHPQSCGALKLGIQLLGKETWLTPWHSVAVHKDGEFILMKRWEAEKLGATLVKDKRNRPSYYELKN